MAQDTQTAELTIESLFAQAEAEESGLATSTDTEPVSPAGDVNAEPDEQTDRDEQTEDAEQVESDEFDFDDIGDEVSDEDSPPTIDLSTKVEVKGHGEVPISELRDGYMRQADYTRGKQALAEDRAKFAAEQEGAAKILASLQDDPVGVAAYLAVETGLMTEAELDRVKIADLRKAVTVPKAEEQQAIMDAKVAELLENHPDVLEARASKVRAAIASEFGAIEGVVGRPLSEKAKVAIIEYANEHDLYDLRVAFDALSAAQARKAKARETVRQASGERPKTRGGLTATSKQTVDSIEEALALAEAEHGAS